MTLSVIREIWVTVPGGVTDWHVSVGPSLSPTPPLSLAVWSMSITPSRVGGGGSLSYTV